MFTNNWHTYVLLSTEAWNPSFVKMKINRDRAEMTDGAAAVGAAIYTKQVLSAYDFFVLGFSNTLIWKCPSRLILDFYNQHVSGKHLDLGVGTGYFLDKCRFPSSDPIIALMDLNPNSLQVTSERLRRYSPMTSLANVLEPIRIEHVQREPRSRPQRNVELAQGSCRSCHRHSLESPGFDSIGLNYLFHCLPGTMQSKGVVFSNLKPLLNDGGVVFGTTILGQDIKRGFLAKTLMNIYNSKGIFSNKNDTLSELESLLKQNFRDHSVQVVGCVAFFVGRMSL